MTKTRSEKNLKLSMFGRSEVGMRQLLNTDFLDFDKEKGLAVAADGIEHRETTEFLPGWPANRSLWIYKPKDLRRNYRP